MSRITPVDPATASEPVARLLGKLAAPLNIFRLMAHAEGNFRPLVKFAGSVLSEQELDARLRELVILLVAQVNRGEYEWVQHVPIGLRCGCTQAEIDALAAGDLEAACFSARDRAALAFARQVIEQVKADDATFAAAKAHMSDREIVEVILTCGTYMMMARLTENAECELDLPAGDALMDRLERQPG